MIYWFRRKIIQLGKLAPFFLVLVVLISYIENENSLYYGLFCDLDKEHIALDQPISFFIGDYFRYDILTVIILYALSFGLEMCWRNKLCIHYLTFNLIVRNLLESTPLNDIVLHTVFIANIVICITIIIINIIGYIKIKK